MDEEVMSILEAAGWKPCDEFAPLKHYYNEAHCGNPADIGNENSEMVLVTRALLNYGVNFSVVARGDSMEGCGIYDGDVLMVRCQNVAQNGDVVLVLVEGNEVTVKNYIEDEDGVVWLVPSNKKYPAICTEDFPDCRIMGKVVFVQHSNPRAHYRDCMQLIKETRKTRVQGKEVTQERLAKALYEVMPEIANSRQWFAIYRAMVDEEIIMEDDFVEFQEQLKNALDDEAPELDLKDLRSMATGSFSKPLYLWDQNNAPVSGKRFFKYLDLGMTFKRAL